MRNLLKLILLGIALFLSFFIFSSVKEKEEFRKEKVERYAFAANQLQDIAEAEKLYLVQYGKYTASLDTLRNYVKTGKFWIVKDKDSTAMVYDPVQQISVSKNFKKIDSTLSKTTVKDSIFGKRNMDNFGYVLVNKQKLPIDMKVNLKTTKIPGDSAKYKRDYFFQASIDRKKVLTGLNEVDLKEELKDNTLINGESISIGSDHLYTLDGNWTKLLEEEIIKHEEQTIINQKKAKNK